jgi:uncharacterized protein
MLPWILAHPFLCLGIYLLLEACLPVWAQPTAWFLRASIRAYQVTLSPILPSACKFTPTCSHYGLGCIRKYGSLRGGILTAWRLVRCSPLTHGGEDPVP